MAVAISAIGAAAAAFGTEAFVGLAITAVADTGMALSVVGAVTGNKKLTQVGAAMGLAGGVGMMANSMFGAAADVAGDAAMGGVGNVDNYAVQQGASADLTSGYTSGAADAADSATNGMADLANTTEAGITASPVSTSSVTGAPLSQQTGTATGGTPALSGSGGNLDPVTGQVAPTSGTTTVSATPGATTTTTTGGSGMGMNGVGNVDNYAMQQGASPDLGSGYTSAGSGIINSSRAGGIIDSIKDVWGKLGDSQKAEVLKAALAVPGGIQAQQNKARELALQASKIQQTSYGSAVPAFHMQSTVRS